MGKIELLAPAGNMECLKAAVNAGCDAVYLGGNHFGARAFSKNFSREEIVQAINYCHLYGVKVYITVNTLIYDDEVEEEPYEISDQQFGEFDDYRTETLFYYFGSGIITDEKDNKIDKPEELIGKNYKEVLESAEDSYFRNENTKVDYEVIVQLNDEDE